MVMITSTNKEVMIMLTAKDRNDYVYSQRW